MAKECRAHIGDDPFADRHHKVITCGAGRREHTHHDDHHAEIAIDQARSFGGEAVIDHATHGHRDDERGTGGDDESDESGAEAALIACRKGQERL